MTTTKYTNIEIGYMDKIGAEKFKEKINGQSYMNFQIILAPSPSGYFVSVETTYEAELDKIRGMLMFCMASSY